MLIEEAFQKYIKHLNILKPKNDKKFDIELKWVKPHICGNKDLPPKQQTYIVIDKSK